MWQSFGSGARRADRSQKFLQHQGTDYDVCAMIVAHGRGKDRPSPATRIFSRAGLIAKGTGPQSLRSTMWNAKLALVEGDNRVVVMGNCRPGVAAPRDIASHGMLAQPGVGVGNGRSYTTSVTAKVAIDIELGRNQLLRQSVGHIAVGGILHFSNGCLLGIHLGSELYRLNAPSLGMVLPITLRETAAPRRSGRSCRGNRR